MQTAVSSHQAFAVDATYSAIINFSRRGCCDDSPRVKCPIETTARCVYFLCLSIRSHYSSFSVCACQPHHLQTRTEKCRCSWNFNPWFIWPSRSIYLLLLLLNLNETNWSGCAKDIYVTAVDVNVTILLRRKVLCVPEMSLLAAEVTLRCGHQPTRCHRLLHTLTQVVAARQRKTSKYWFIAYKSSSWQPLMSYIIIVPL